MAQPSTRAELKAYCLRRLGDGVIEINVSDAQVEDRLDDAIQWFQEFHMDAVKKDYAVHAITQDDIDNQYITVDNDISSVSRIFPTKQSVSSGLFDIRYQIRLNDPFTYKAAGGLDSYFITKTYLNLLQNILSGETPIKFNRYENKLYIDDHWEEAFDVGEYVIMEVYRILDPETITDIYNDSFLKKYATALIMWQWGQNLSKWDNVILPGGVTMNADGLISRAELEMKELDQELRATWMEPPHFIVG